MTARTAPLARARVNIQAAKAASEEVLDHLDASRKVGGCWRCVWARHMSQRLPGGLGSDKMPSR